MFTKGTALLVSEAQYRSMEVLVQVGSGSGYEPNEAGERDTDEADETCGPAERAYGVGATR